MMVLRDTVEQHKARDDAFERKREQAAIDQGYPEPADMDRLKDTQEYRVNRMIDAFSRTNVTATRHIDLRVLEALVGMGFNFTRNYQEMSEARREIAMNNLRSLLIRVEQEMDDTRPVRKGKRLGLK